MPLHHAVVCNRPAMVELLLELGADANAADLSGAAPIAYAHRPAVESGIMQMLLDAGGQLDLIGALTLGRYDVAEAMLEEDPARLGPDGRDTIALHLAVDRRDETALRWLIEHGVDVNAKRTLYNCNQTPLHVCAERGLVDIAAQLLQAGGGHDDPRRHVPRRCAWLGGVLQAARSRQAHSRAPGGAWQCGAARFRLGSVPSMPS